MKKPLIIIILIILSGRLFAQVPQTRTRTQAPLPPPLTSREVSGIVKDETGQTVIGATVTLKSKLDTIRTATNEDGIFVLKDVKLATFNITVQGIGYSNFVKKYLNSDVTKRIVLDPIVLKAKANQLNEVTINGTPTITYKTDTVEYRATDYKVRENATLDELLKKMEGMEVGSDGTLTHQGQQVTRAKLNGKEYAGGDVAQAIQNLPADIIEKVQIVDDYGDQAARTGIKDGDPQKVLNVTTKADKSVGTTARAIGQYGSNDRYNAQLFVQRINGNEQLGLIGNLRNTINGVASTGLQGGAANGGGRSGGSGTNYTGTNGGSPGTTRSGAPTLNYRDQWSKDIQVVGSYAYNFANNYSINNSYGQKYSHFGPSNFVDQNTSERDSKGHTFHFEIDDNIDKSNYLQINPTFTYSNTTTSTNSLADNINNYTTGFEHRLDNGVSTSLNSSTSFGLTAFYLHVFKKARRNISLQLGFTHQTQQANGGTDKTYHYFADTTQNTPLPALDSAINFLTTKTNRTAAFQATATYVEPLGPLSQVELRSDIRRSNNDSKSIQDTVLANGQLKELTALDNIYNYTTTQSHITANYRFNGKKVNLTLGASAIPYNLTGNKVDNNTGVAVSTSHSTFKIIPAFRFAYAWSSTQRFQLTYSGAYNEPNFQYIQPFTDRTDPLNIIVGNPDLNPSFTNSLNAAYNNYIANSKVNISFNVNATAIDGQITTNTFLRKRVKNTGDTTYYNEIHYINIDGTKSVTGRYTLSKQLDDRRYNFTLNGNITYNYSPTESNDVLYHQTEWRFNERFGPRINPNDNIEINPYISYDLDRSFTNEPNSLSTTYKTTSLAIDGKLWFLKTFQINYSATKSYVSVSGLNNANGVNTHPLVINLGFQKEFLQSRNLVFTFDVYDILHQNTFVQQTINTQGVTNTLSNTLSRYFLVGLRLNLQKWSGRPQRNGREMQRRGDGSFIY